MRTLTLSHFFALCALGLSACHDATADSMPVVLDDFAAAAVEDLAPPQIDAAQPPPPSVVCGAMFPGPPLKSDVTEALPDYVAQLDALDLKTIPDPFDYSAESKLSIAVINYMLGRSQGTTVSHEDARKTGLGRAVLGAAAKGTGGKLDFSFLRRGLYHFYPCSRPFPADLTAFRARYGDYQKWPVQQLDCARPKNGPRRLYEDLDQGIYVAETIVAGVVRETEVLFTSLRSDGQLDFAAYTEEGKLSDRSTFATASGSSVVLAAPYTCISCHIDTMTWNITRKMPTGTGAGCR